MLPFFCSLRPTRPGHSNIDRRYAQGREYWQESCREPKRRRNRERKGIYFFQCNAETLLAYTYHFGRASIRCRGYERNQNLCRCKPLENKEEIYELTARLPSKSTRVDENREGILLSNTENLYS